MTYVIAEHVKDLAGWDADRMRLKEAPKLDPCWQGAEREWIAEAKNYRFQLWCPVWKTWLNPTGFTCQACRDKTWPDVERFRTHILPDLTMAGKAADGARMVLHAAERGLLSFDEAVALGEEFHLDVAGSSGAGG